jgi:hypothetical protein
MKLNEMNPAGRRMGPVEEDHAKLVLGGSVYSPQEISAA